ncbi:hypothetical protein HK104_005664 [Borealophlyctis nickersoniae]|nr:hypothetical protein HK104_005664 [Borealophlyctis nickersoniae]
MSSGMLILAQVTRKPEPPQPPPRVRRTGGRKVAVAPSSSPAASAASCSALAPNGGIRFRPYPPPSTLSAAAPAADKPDGDTTPSSSLIITTTTTTTTAAPLPAATTVIPPSSFLAPPTVPERPHTKLARETAALDRLTRLLDQKEADLVGLRRKAVEASSILDGAKQPLVDFSFANLRARQAIDALKPWIKNPNRFSPLDAEMLERDVQSLDREQEVIKAELERTGLVPM